MYTNKVAGTDVRKVITVHSKCILRYCLDVKNQAFPNRQNNSLFLPIIFDLTDIKVSNTMFTVGLRPFCRHALNKKIHYRPRTQKCIFSSSRTLWTLKAPT